ncbi:hypothetical protein LR48_Vigan03g188800 [Vigna angularis]|uniref:Uncharacterized protein n=2 Tax=Phaseolus angularis TaxID=3914 RepID=A0A0L9U6Y2_PHAAN|nr:hypothetical protein LR48_Vigan03g188800 [Vigna angularis]BAT84894.1 hypothetical protein VIGAN_04236400 [Vigna angularis var. angularis]
MCQPNPNQEQSGVANAGHRDSMAAHSSTFFGATHAFNNSNQGTSDPKTRNQNQPQFENFTISTRKKKNKIKTPISINENPITPEIPNFPISPNSNPKIREQQNPKPKARCRRRFRQSRRRCPRHLHAFRIVSSSHTNRNPQDQNQK